MEEQEQIERMNLIFRKAESDAAFRSRLEAEPTATLRAEGMLVPPGMEVRIVTNTPQLMHLVLPATQR